MDMGASPARELGSTALLNRCLFPYATELNISTKSTQIKKKFTSELSLSSALI